MRYSLTPYINNSMLPATRALAKDWEPDGFSVDRLTNPYRHGDKLWRSDHGLDITFDSPLPDGISEQSWQMRLCDRLFTYLNQDDRPNGRTERSLSVGDVVAVSTPSGTVYYACETVGWKHIAPPTAENILN